MHGLGTFEFFFALFIIFVFVGLILWSGRLIKFASINFKNIARLLHAEVNRPFLNLPVYLVIDERYEGRTVVFSFIGILSSAVVTVWMEPNLVLDTNRSSGHVTKNVSLAIGRKQLYYGRGVNGPPSIFLRKMTDEEISLILKELLEASRIVETALVNEKIK